MKNCWNGILLAACVVGCQAGVNGAGDSSELDEPAEDEQEERAPRVQLPVASGGGAGGGSGGFFCDYGPADDRHIIDGEFSTLGEDDCLGREWDFITPLPGRYTQVYFDLTPSGLYLLNDWSLNEDGPIDPNCYNRFNFVIGQVDRWEIRVFGSGGVEAWRNGVQQTQGVEGAAGFAPSPLNATPHTIYELKVPAPPPDGGWVMQACDPPGPSTVPTWSPPPPSTAPQATTVCDATLATEPTIYEGRVGPNPGDGLVDVRGVVAPRLTGSGGAPRPGAPWLIIGAHLDAADSLKAFIGGMEVPLLERTDHHVRVAVPSDLPAGPLGVRLKIGDEWTNPLSFEGPGPVCEPDCTGAVCGDDGCGGTCGECFLPDRYCHFGRCERLGPVGCQTTVAATPSSRPAPRAEPVPALVRGPADLVVGARRRRERVNLAGTHLRATA